MTTINVYLDFNGNCEEAFLFYKSVFGGELTDLFRYNDAPPGEEMPVPEEMANQIMHVSLPISKETALMGSDTGGEMGPPLVVGNNFSISINSENKQEVERLFNELSVGGQVIMPLEKTFWSDLFGMFTDKFGINWMVSYYDETSFK